MRVSQVLVTLLTVLALVSSGYSLIEVDYGFPEGSVCKDSAHILTLSIPISCNSALLDIVGEEGLPVDLLTGADDLGDLCQTYCTTPMRQVGEDCQALNVMHQTITGACDMNNNSIRCFALREWLLPVLGNCSSGECSSECRESLTQAHSRMGCCYTTLLSTSAQYSQDLDLCNLTSPTPCSQATLCHTLPWTLASLTLLALIL